MYGSIKQIVSPVTDPGFKEASLDYKGQKL